MTDTPRKNDPVQPGDIIGGLFRITRKFNAGGMGTVFLAEQANIGRTVVIKLMQPQLTDQQRHIERFKREATLMSMIHHPNVVTVYAFGETDNANLYLAMEFVDGPSLSTFIDDRQPLSLGRALDIAEQILGALSQAHACGVVHRDLKPDNIILSHTADGVERVKVLDFGIASFNAGAVTSLTNDNAVIGTPRYMSPEQVNGQPIDGRSDLYSLGVILYEMLTGSHPIRAESPVQFLLGHISQQIPPLKSDQPNASSIPPAVNAFVLKALSKSPDDRFSSAPEMLSTLQHLRLYYSASNASLQSLNPSQHNPLTSPDPHNTEAGDEGDVFVTTRMAALPTTANNFGAQASEIERVLQNKQTFPSLDITAIPPSPLPPSPSTPTLPPTIESNPPTSPPHTPQNPTNLAPGLIVYGSTPYSSPPSPPPPPPKPTPLWVYFGASFSVGMFIIITIWLLRPPPQQPPQEPTATTPLTPTSEPTTLAATQSASTKDTHSPPDPPDTTDTPDTHTPDTANETTPDTVSPTAHASAHVAPPDPPAPDIKPKIKHIYTGPYTSFALLHDGRVLAWGNNAQGQLGIGRAQTDTSAPVFVLDLPSPAIDLAVGGPTSPVGPLACAILQDKRVFCWGSGEFIPSANSPSYPTPVEAPALYGAHKLSLGSSHGCAITETRDVACWGYNAGGALGLGDSPPYQSAKTPTPIPLPGPWVEVVAGYAHTCAMTQDNNVFCWGQNSYNRVSPTKALDEKLSTPVKVATWPGETVSLHASESQSCSLLQGEGVARCWGASQQAVVVLTTQAKHLAMHSQHACVIHSDDRLRCWGYNNYGQLGSGDRTSQSIAFSDARTPAIPSTSPPKEVSVSNKHTCVLLENEQIFCWGHNRYGQLGDGTLRDSTAPVEVLLPDLSANVPPPLPSSPALLPDKPPPTAPPATLPAACAPTALNIRDSRFPSDFSWQTYDVGAYFNPTYPNQLSLRFANYDAPPIPDRLYDEVLEPGTSLRGQRRALYVLLEHKLDPPPSPSPSPEPAPTPDPTPFALGRYAASSEQNTQRIFRDAYFWDRHGNSLYASGPDRAVELTHLDPDWLCGSISITHENGSIKGTFATPIRR